MLKYIKMYFFFILTAIFVIVGGPVDMRNVVSIKV